MTKPQRQPIIKHANNMHLDNLMREAKRTNRAVLWTPDGFMFINYQPEPAEHS